MDLNNDKPLDTLDPVNAKWLANLQGNILNGHGRDNTVHLFLRLPGDPKKAKSAVRQLKHYVTSALKQEKERIQFKKYDIPGGLFGNLFLSARGYAKLGYSPKELEKAFTEPEEKIRAVQSNFLEGMAKHAETDLGDPPPEQWEDGFRKGGIDAMLLLADDDDGYLLREARNFLDSLPEQTDVVHIERGTALRTREGEGIEHFGYVDGRSQPLFLASDFQDLEGGAIGPNTREKDGGKVDVWNPFEPLKLVLLPDPLAKDPDCLGSYFVFRKLEQNVRGFIIKEQDLADKLKLEGTDRERAGAMAVGRFRDGTPLVLSPTDGFAPPKENNFRYDSSDPERLNVHSTLISARPTRAATLSSSVPPKRPNGAVASRAEASRSEIATLIRTILMRWGMYPQVEWVCCSCASRAAFGHNSLSCSVDGPTIRISFVNRIPALIQSSVRETPKMASLST
jgi:deferrochelatase/peroxidase EfeB